jgi:hypothetical protein
MRAKFIRGQDPKKAMGLGIDGEVEKVGYYEKFGDEQAPIQEPAYRAHELFRNWEDVVDDNYVFRYKGNEDDDWYNMDPEQLVGKTIIYDGEIYTIPEGPIPPA